MSYTSVEDLNKIGDMKSLQRELPLQKDISEEEDVESIPSKAETVIYRPRATKATVKGFFPKNIKLPNVIYKDKYINKAQELNEKKKTPGSSSVLSREKRQYIEEWIQAHFSHFDGQASKTSDDPKD